MLERVNIHLEILYRLDIVSRYHTFNNDINSYFLFSIFFGFYSAFYLFTLVLLLCFSEFTLDFTRILL